MTDVLIVGAGPAGSTLATLLTRSGLRVTVLDRTVFPRPKPCAEFLSPGVVSLLHELGVGKTIERAAGARLHGFTVYAHGRATMRGTFGQARGWRSAPRYGLGVPRTVLDTKLVALARASGAEVCERTRVIDVLRDGTRVIGVRALTPNGSAEFRAPLLIGADGITGVVGRRLGMIHPRENMRRVGLVAHVGGIDGLGDHGEMHVIREGYCGVAPLGSGVANVAMVLRRPPIGRGELTTEFLRLMQSFPVLAPRLTRAAVETPVLARGQMSLRARTLVGAGVLLAGDAGGFYDPFTGQGVYKAMRSAFIAAPVIREALGANDTSRQALLPYERRRREEFRAEFAVEWLVQQFLGHPALFNRAIRLLGERAAMADTLVGVTGDVLPARRVLSPLFLARLAL